MLLPPPSGPGRLATTPPAVVVAVQPGSTSVLERAIAIAARRRVVLHVVIAEHRRSPLHTLLGARTAADPAAEACLARARALGVDVEVHRTPGCPHALTAAIAETLGGAVAR